MTDARVDLKALIHGSWRNALEKTTFSEGFSGESCGQIHRERARAWVDNLGRAFQRVYSDDDQRVFWIANECNKKEFGLQELLFDISVCQVRCVKSIRQEKPLQYISNCFWQVESELNNKNSREITKDFSKLVMGQSENKLFISSYQGSMQQKVRCMCSKIACYCTGNLYLCFIGHPEEWLKNPNSPSLYKWEDNGWTPL